MIKIYGATYWSVARLANVYQENHSVESLREIWVKLNDSVNGKLLELCRSWAIVNRIDKPKTPSVWVSLALHSVHLYEEQEQEEEVFSWAANGYEKYEGEAPYESLADDRYCPDFNYR